MNRMEWLQSLNVEKLVDYLVDDLDIDYLTDQNGHRNISIEECDNKEKKEKVFEYLLTKRYILNNLDNIGLILDIIDKEDYEDYLKKKEELPVCNILVSIYTIIRTLNIEQLISWLDSMNIRCLGNDNCNTYCVDCIDEYLKEEI